MDHKLEMPSDDEDFIWDLDEKDIDKIVNDDDLNYYDDITYLKELYEYDLYKKRKEKEKNIKTASAITVGGALSGGIGYMFGITAGIICTISTITGSAVIYNTS